MGNPLSADPAPQAGGGIPERENSKGGDPGALMRCGGIPERENSRGGDPGRKKNRE